MIPEIEQFLDDLSNALGVKRQALSLLVDHLGYSVKCGGCRCHLKSLDVKEAVDGLKANAKIIKLAKANIKQAKLEDKNLYGGGYGD
jgi:hypothetical protein